MEHGNIFVRVICVIYSLAFCYNLHGQDIKPVSWWESKFEKDTSFSYPLDNKMSLSKDSWDLYKLAYGLDAYNSMYRATKNNKYLDKSINLVQNVINSSVPSNKLARSQFKDNYLSWANRSHEENGDDGKEYPLFESFFWRYVTALLRIIDDSDELKKVEKYRNAFNEILEFSEINIYNKWSSRGAGNIYRSNTHMFSHWARICLDLWVITGKTTYKNVVDDFNELFFNQVQLGLHAKRSYWWQASWIKEKRSIFEYIFPDKSKYRSIRGQDIPHGNAVIAYVIEAFEVGHRYTRKDIDRLINTFTEVVWKENDQMAMYLDGSGNSHRQISDGFMKLGRFNKELQHRLESMTPAKNTVYNRWAQFYANGALNAAVIIANE